MSEFDVRTDDDPPGLDISRLAGWFVLYVPGAGEITSARLIAGGRSNLTYEVGDGTNSWILRRPPVGHLVATAHEMGREYRVMSALAETAVPVPVTYVLCEDDSVIGAQFYVMQKVDGTPFRRASELEALGAERVRAISTRLVDVLATLHSIDQQAVGLGEFGRSTGFLSRQIRRWSTQFQATKTRELPAAAELAQRLAARVPDQSAATIVHGDYRLDNVLIDDNDQVTAVLDWEMATLGDPITDLALLSLYQRLARLPGGTVVTDAADTPGFLSEAEVRQRYVEVSGRRLDNFGFYLGLAHYKFAGIVEGIHYRSVNHQTVGEGFDQYGLLTEPLLEAGLAALKEQF
ncbi:phosphotransferase family protein [Dactylosporangium sp. AC04546]|uniref:phosphotransferase family protein n=1 Tax=Dactylosporangium sp. AC04546 TaxID=2862460 RepID=UPI001EDD82C1|nr:phosphotransferase family protein [Dactylosporangium sp. AC04546]WVK86451.1 phosphotransferase family protein [Dactylosporangium sp. AC04546]